MSTTTSNAPKRQRKKPARFCKLLHYPDGTLALIIRQVLSSTREQVDAYHLTEIEPVDQGRGFALRKPEGTRYDVNVGGREDSCDCPGHLQHGHKTVCKHRASLAKLIALGKL